MLNNVLANLRFGVEQVDFQSGSDGPVDRNASVPGGMVEGGSLYQNTLFNSNLLFGASDFNPRIPGSASLFINAAGGNFFPADFSFAIDGAIDTVPEQTNSNRSGIRSGWGFHRFCRRTEIGRSTARGRSQSGYPVRPGANVFKDRGSLDRADFVGPRRGPGRSSDNDVRRLDCDPSVSVVQLQSGIWPTSDSDCRRLRAADPFPGVGVDDRTLTGRTIRWTKTV